MQRRRDAEVVNGVKTTTYSDGTKAVTTETETG